MSFQKRNQIIGGNRASFARPAVGGPRVNSNQGKPFAPVAPAIKINEAVKPSTVHGEPTVSSGCSDLNKSLVHGGIPLGTLVFLEEQGSTDYATSILKYFVAQGVIHSRSTTAPTHTIVVGTDNSWTRELPGEYKGSKKDVKKQNIIENELKISVQNVINNPSSNQRGSLKIAWRYGLNQGTSPKDVTVPNNKYPNYSTTFDITTRLLPSPTAQEITFVPFSNTESTTRLYKQIESIVKSQTNNGTNEKVVRITMPNLLNPITYPKHYFSPGEILPFLHLLKNLSRKFSKNVVIVSSVNTEESQGNALVKLIEAQVFDFVFQLVPFPHDLVKLLKVSYKNQPNKIQQGFFNILKIYGLSDRGAMTIKMNEYAFRNGRRMFEISEWSIPLEEDTVDDKNKELQGVEPPSTNKNIEF